MEDSLAAPIAEAGGVNLYAYCENDPVSHSDPDGTWGEATTAGLFLAPETGGLSIPGGLLIDAALLGAALGGAWWAGQQLGGAGQGGGTGQQLGGAGQGARAGAASSAKGKPLSRRCKKVKRDCIDQCSKTPPLGGDRCNQGAPFQKCYNKCMADNDCPSINP